MKKVFEKGGEEQKAFREVYELASNYFIPEDTDKYWDDFIDAADKVIKENNLFARYLVRGLSDYLEHEFKRKRGNNNEHA